MPLPSCCPGFKSQAHNLCFFLIYIRNVLCEKDKNKRDWPSSKKLLNLSKTINGGEWPLQQSFIVNQVAKFVFQFFLSKRYSTLGKDQCKVGVKFDWI